MANLFWQHPNGDTTTIPCLHPGVQHPNGDTRTVPCIHPRVQQHSNDGKLGRKTIPCIHWVSPHPDGDTATIPCIHPAPLHPGGHPGPVVNCIHPMLPVRLEPPSQLVFFTDNGELQQAAINAIRILHLLLNRNINSPLFPRPLNIFHRDPVNGNPNDANDPFWSHYENQTHSIQITRGALSGANLVDVLYHEMGHAILGHQCVRIPSPGGTHNLTDVIDPALAMSEGWADFVALALRYNTQTQNVQFAGMNWETMNVTPNFRIEYCVGSALWDLYDVPNESGRDRVSLPFTELFRVYSPTLQTLSSGPVIPSIRDYMQRLRQNNPALAGQITGVERLNVG